VKIIQKLIFFLKEILKDVSSCIESIKRIRKFHTLCEDKQKLCENFKRNDDYNFRGSQNDFQTFKNKLKISEIILAKELA
jgi:hypothetical protein